MLIKKVIDILYAYVNEAKIAMILADEVAWTTSTRVRRMQTT